MDMVDRKDEVQLPGGGSQAKGVALHQRLPLGLFAQHIF